MTIGRHRDTINENNEENHGAAMTKLLEDAFTRARELPEDEQNSIGVLVLREIDSETRWDELFSHPKSADVLSRLADQAIAQVRAGRARKLDVNDL